MQGRFNTIADKEDRIIRMNTNKSSIKLGTQEITVRLKATNPKTHNTLIRYYRAYTALCNLISEAAYTYNTVDLNQILPG